MSQTNLNKTLDNLTLRRYNKHMNNTTEAQHTPQGLIAKVTYDLIVETNERLSKLAYSEGLTKKQLKAINKAWSTLSEIVNSDTQDDDDPFA